MVPSVAQIKSVGRSCNTEMTTKISILRGKTYRHIAINVYMKSTLLTLLFAASIFCAASAQEKSTKVGFADIQYIISQLAESKEIEAQLKSTQEKLQADYTAKSQQFQKDYSEYVQGMQTMVDTVRAQKESQLQQMSAELQQLESDAQRTLENQQKLLLAPVYLKVSNAIDAVAAENGFQLVLNKQVSGMNVFLFTTETRDISKLVIERLSPAGK